MTLTGFWQIVKLIARRDRIKLPLWILGILAMSIGMLPILKQTYGTPESLTAAYASVGTNPMGRLFTGAMDGSDFGSLFSVQTVLWAGLVIAFANILLIIRHTRQNEETGAMEMLLSARVGRFVPLIAALFVAFVTNMIIVITLGIGLQAEFGAERSWLYGLSFGGFGMACAAIAALAAQLTENARSAVGISASVMGIAFVLRGAGDFLGSTNTEGIFQPQLLSYFSPFGWMQLSHSLTYPQWWALVLPLGFTVLGIAAACALLARRDMGAGILPTRKGNARASRFLRTPLGLTWRLQKTTCLAWAAGIILTLALCGGLASSATETYKSSPAAEQIVMSLGGEGDIVSSFLAAMLSMSALFVLAYALQALGRLDSEESQEHLEQLLAASLSRPDWLLMHTLIVLAASAGMLAASGLALAATANLTTELNLDVMAYIGAGLSYWPAVAFVAGLYVFLFGFAPRAAAPIAWLYYIFVVFIAFFADMLSLPPRTADLSVLHHFAAAPSEQLTLWPLLITALLAKALLTAGAQLLGRRDIVGR